MPGLVEEARMALPFSSLSPFGDPFGGDTEVLLFLCFLCASPAAEDAGRVPGQAELPVSCQ